MSGSVTVRLVTAFLLLTITEIASADWRGWFDDYGSTFDECVDTQKRELLRNSSVGNATSRAMEICWTIWEVAPAEYQPYDGNVECKYKWGYRHDKGFFRSETKPSSILLSCNEGVDKVVVRLDACDASTQPIESERAFGFSDGVDLIVDAGCPLTKDDHPKLSVVHAYTDINKGRYVRKD